MHSGKYKLGIVLIGLLLAACSTYYVSHSKVYNEAVLTDYKTFAIAQPEPNSMPAQMTMREFNMIADAVRNQMLLRGYQESQRPELVVYIGISIRDRIQTKDAIPPVTPYYFGRRGAWLRNYYAGTQLITGVDKEGTLSVDIVDERNQKVAFAGAVGSVMDQQQHIRDLKELNEAMAKLFQKFPIPPIR